MWNGDATFKCSGEFCFTLMHCLQVTDLIIQSIGLI